MEEEMFVNSPSISISGSVDGGEVEAQMRPLCMIEGTEGTIGNSSQTCNASKPYIGMKFNTHEEAYDFYNAYGLLTGFGIRRSSTNYSRKTEKVLLDKKFVCDKEGHKSIKDKRNEGKVVNHRRETRVGCIAMMRIKLLEDGKWELSAFVEEHTNHELSSPDKVKMHRSQKQFHRSEAVKQLIGSMFDTVKHRNIGVGNILMGRSNIRSEEQTNLLKYWALRARFNNVLDMLFKSSNPTARMQKLDNILSDFMTEDEVVGCNQMQGVKSVGRAGPVTQNSHTIEHMPQITVCDPDRPIRTKGHPPNASGIPGSVDGGEVEAQMRPLCMIEGTEGTIRSSSQACNTSKPYIGMKFNTHEDAYDFYNAYGLLTGFGIRRSSTNYSRKTEKILLDKKFVCDKEGHKSIKDKRDEGKVVNHRRVSRVGCIAMMRIKLLEDGKWEVSAFVEEHTNHELPCPDKVKMHRSQKQFHRSEAVEQLIGSMFDTVKHCNIGVGNILMGRSNIRSEEQTNLLKYWALRARFHNVLDMLFKSSNSTARMQKLDNILSDFVAEGEIVECNQMQGVKSVGRAGPVTQISHTIEHMPQITVCDSDRPIRTKGRPPNARRWHSGKEQAQENNKKQKRSCMRCGHPGHYRTSCTNPPTSQDED